MQLKVEIVQHIQKLLALVGQTKLDYNINSYVHTPKTSMTYIYYSVICEDYEADAYDIWGAVTSMDETSLPTAIQHLSKARAIYNLLGVRHKSEDTNYRISVLSGRVRTGSTTAPTSATPLGIKTFKV